MPRRFLAVVCGLLARISLAVRDPRARSHMPELTLGLLCADRPKTVTSVLEWLGRRQQDWSPYYRLLSQDKWCEDDLFRPILHSCCQLAGTPGAPFISAQDDTLARKTGRQIPGTSFARDPMSPPFHVNLIQGQRFLQTAAMLATAGPVPLYRSVPVAFEHAPPLKAPKRATEEQKQAVREARKKQNLGTIAAAELERLRLELDHCSGGLERLLINSVDGGFANRTYLRSIPARTAVVARIRRDAHFRAFLPLPQRRGSRKYGPDLPTPEQMLADPAVPLQTMEVAAGGKLHTLKFKVVEQVCWPGVTGDTPIRVILIKPLGYRLRQHGRLLYRQPAFLVAVGADADLRDLIQAYFARWQIEVSFRDEKSLLGLGEAQLWHPESVHRGPALLVACYSCLLLASIMEFGDRRTDALEPLPRWRSDRPLRPSTRELLKTLRSQAEELRQSAPTDLAAVA
jgi:hypothetical protein